MEQTGQSPSYDELAVLVTVLKTKLEEFEAENAELKRRLGRNSRNSSAPPSADGLEKPPPRSMWGKSGRRPGKQSGSPGIALARVTNPDRRVKHFPPQVWRVFGPVEPVEAGRGSGPAAGVRRAGDEGVRDRA